MTNLNIVFNAENAKQFPLYCKYDGQIEPQRAFITLDLRTGSLDADYSGDIGAGVPADVWERKILRFNVDENISAADIVQLISDNETQLKKLLVMYAEEKHDEIADLADEIEQRCAAHVSENYRIDCLEDWLDGQWPEPEQTLDDYIQELLGTNGDAGYWFVSTMDTAETLRTAVLLFWADILYCRSRVAIPAHVAQILISEGTCDDSQWIDELKEIAAQSHS